MNNCKANKGSRHNDDYNIIQTRTNTIILLYVVAWNANACSCLFVFAMWERKFFLALLMNIEFLN